MIVGIVGLGLISGSMAKAYSAANHTVLAWNRSLSILEFAIMEGTVDAALDEHNIRTCDLILVGLPPEASIQWIRENADRIHHKTLVMDLCGTKQVVCNAIFPLAKEKGFRFVGGHPMAGNQFSGYKNAYATLFVGAPMVLVPPDPLDYDLVDTCKRLLTPVCFGGYSVTSAEEHDRIIAYTSQMCHVVSNAFVKSPTAKIHRGYSAGSYKDLTRVAWLNADMWSELMLENKTFLLQEMDILMQNLQAYRDAIEAGDQDTLRQLLQEGRECKEEVDGL